MSLDQGPLYLGDPPFVLQKFVAGEMRSPRRSDSLPATKATHVLTDPATGATASLNSRGFRVHSLRAPDGVLYVLARFFLFPGAVPVPIPTMIQAAEFTDPTNRYAPATEYHHMILRFTQRLAQYDQAKRALAARIARLKHPDRSTQVAVYRERIQAIVEHQLATGLVTDQTQIDLASHLYMTGTRDPFELVEVVSAISNGNSTTRDPASAAHETHITISS